MGQFQSKGWKHLHKMEDILPGDMATGTRAYHGGTSTNIPADNPTLSADCSIHPVLSVAPPIHLALSGALDPSESVDLDLILSTGALDPQAPIDPILTGPGQSQALAFRLNAIAPAQAPGLAPGSSSTKRPFSSTLSPDETNQSVLFSPAIPPSSVISASSAPKSAIQSFPPTKRSRTSGVGTQSPSQISGPVTNCPNRAAGKGTTNVMLQAVNSTLRHLSDHLGNRFCDPLKAIEDALEHLNNNQQIDRQKRRWFRAHLSTNSGSAVAYLSIADDQDRIDFVDDLYEIHHAHPAVL
jgi:hypothetical protein